MASMRAITDVNMADSGIRRHGHKKNKTTSMKELFDIEEISR